MSTGHFKPVGANIFRDSHGNPLKRSGHNEREVHPKDFVSLVKDIFDIAGYGKLLEQRLRQTEYKDFQSNESFWNRVIRGELREGMRVRLRDFHLIEWVPISPGRFFTPQAAAARERALEYVYDGREFLPLGKCEMVFGGIGSARLKSRVIDSERLFCVCATSSGVSHEGIPLIIRHADIDQLLSSFADEGGARCNVSGWIRLLPEELSLIGGCQTNRWGIESGLSTPLAKYCIEVEKIRMGKASRKGELLTTVAIMFPTNYYRGRDSREGPVFTMGGYKTYCKKSWSFCSFDPSDGISAIQTAATWLQEYAGRYSENPRGENDVGKLVPIFSDFDEHCDHFPNKVEFPIAKIREGNIDLKRLEMYRQAFGFSIQVTAKNIIMGDQIEQNISGGIFHGPVAAKMEHCTNIISQQLNDARKQLLVTIQDEVKGLINQLPSALREEAADNLKLLVDAAVATEPRRKWYECSAQGLLEASKFVKDFTGNLVGTIGQLGKLLWPDFHLPNAEKK